MLIPIRSTLLLIISLHFILACDQQPTPKATEPTPQTTETPPKTAETTPETTKASPKTPKTIKTEEPKAAVPSPQKVHRIQFHGEPFPGELPPGELLDGFAFLDAVGKNFVAFTRTETSTEDHIHSSVLRIKHAVQKPDDTVSEVRSYTERIDNCDFDIMLAPFFGEWSVSDVDNNGIGEANFAYTADCVSDVSPLKFKLFITEAGQKYVLRGHTILHVPGEDPYGGDYNADEMPPAFLKHAQNLWKTVAKL